MNQDKELSIVYQSGNLGYERVRTRVLQNKERLVDLGYQCHWTQDLDLSKKLKDSDLFRAGYSSTRGNDRIIANFEGHGLPFAVIIFPESNRAKVCGDGRVQESGLDEVRRNFDIFERETGIYLAIRKVGEHPRD